MSPSDLQKKFEEAMRQSNAQSNALHGPSSVYLGPSFPTPPYIPTYPTHPIEPNSNRGTPNELLQRLHQRMGWTNISLAMRGIYTVELPDKVVVFLALQDKYLVLEDDPANFPSDKLIAALRLLA